MIDLLRCVNAHEDTWLVASFREISDRIVIEGTLGCPACSAQYEIRNGIADFTGGERSPGAEATRSAAGHRREEMATRAGAFLDVTRAGTTIVLGGVWAHAAQELAALADVRVIALNPPRDVKDSERVGLIRISREIPLAANSAQGVALDAWFPAATVEDAVRVARHAGRIVGPTSIPAPASAVVLAHDEHYWVAEKAPEIVELKREGRRGKGDAGTGQGRGKGKGRGTREAGAGSREPGA